MAVKAFETFFDYGQVVVADRGDVRMTAIGFLFTQSGGCQVKCAWFVGGAHHENWFDEWRLKRAD